MPANRRKTRDLQDINALGSLRICIRVITNAAGANTSRNVACARKLKLRKTAALATAALRRASNAAIETAGLWPFCRVSRALTLRKDFAWMVNEVTLFLHVAGTQNLLFPRDKLIGD